MTSLTTDDEFQHLSELTRSRLSGEWRSCYGFDPPKGISKKLMVRAVAHGAQLRRHGKLKASVARQLVRISGRSSSDLIKTGKGRQLHPGSRLIRDWNGVTHTVDVTDDGFDWKGEHYGSLSEIAREITGARWSGPRFFGLNGRAAS